jgi:phosphoribosylanthranilate isomerase
MAGTQAPTTVKICGLQSVEVIKSMMHLPVDHIGFVFAKSKRQVTPRQAGEMIDFLRKSSWAPRPLTVGVFVNPTAEELSETLKEAPLDVVQLHSQESPEFCKWVKEQLKVDVYKVISVKKESDSAPSMEAVRTQLDPYRGSIDAVLLDTFDPVYGGGSGKTFAWDCIPPYQQWAREAGVRFLVAGGLHPENVGELIAAYRPDGVDVSSGVETDGTKDIHKITAFVERVKQLGTST